MTYKEQIYPVVDTSKLSVLFVADKELIAELEKEGMDLLSVCGMTLQA